MTVLVIAEHDGQTIKSVTLNTLAAARRLEDEIHLLVAGDACAEAVAAAAQIDGVAKVLQCEAPHYAAQGAENLAELVLSIAQEYSHILAPASVSGRNLLPRIAASLDVAQISDVTAILSKDTFVRPIYAGNALATVQSADRIKVMTVRPTAFDAQSYLENAAAVVETLVPAADLGLSRLLGRELTESERPELGAARVVVSGGRGLGSADNYHALLEPLADRLGAALGASRAAVDAEYVPNDYQVGQTGKIVAPQLYLAVGISGAIQHLAGMKDSKIIVAINKDVDAPIFEVADYGLVADLFEAVPELTAALA